MKKTNVKRQRVYKAIDSERDYQDVRWPPRPDGQAKPVAGYLVMLQDYLNEAFRAWTRNPGDAAALEILRKLGGIIVQCGEAHGLPQREGFER